MNDQHQDSIFPQYGKEAQLQPLSKTFMSNVFLWMFAALGISAAFAYLFAANPYLLTYLIDFETGKRTLLGYIVMFAPLAFVMTMSFGFHRISKPALIALYVLYAAVTGVSLSFITFIYAPGSIIICFVSAAAMFGVMGALGYTTDKDLTSMGRILFMALIGIVIASVINIFMRNPMMDYVISIIGIIVFTGLTAWDVQKLKMIGAGLDMDGSKTEEDARKLAIRGALTLYLDFINLFLYLLRVFGRRK